MNCIQFAAKTKLHCSPIRTTFGEEGLLVLLPFAFIDGAPITAYVVPGGDKIRITDGGDTLFHLHNLGFRLIEDRRRWASVREVVAPFGITVSKGGEFELWANDDDLDSAMSKFSAAMLSITHWEQEHLHQPINGTMLFAEIKEYLLMLRPNANIKEGQIVTGISGRNYTFPMTMNGVLIDAMSASPQSTSSIIRRLVDIRAVPSQTDIDIEIAVDDRGGTERISQDIRLLEVLATPLRVSSLLKQIQLDKPTLLS